MCGKKLWTSTGGLQKSLRNIGPMCGKKLWKNAGGLRNSLWKHRPTCGKVGGNTGPTWNNSAVCGKVCGKKCGNTGPICGKSCGTTQSLRKNCGNTGPICGKSCGKLRRFAEKFAGKNLETQARFVEKVVEQLRVCGKIVETPARFADKVVEKLRRSAEKLAEQIAEELGFDQVSLEKTRIDITFRNFFRFFCKQPKCVQICFRKQPMAVNSFIR